MQAECPESEIDQNQNIKNGQILGILQGTMVARTAYQNSKSVLAGLEKW